MGAESFGAGTNGATASSSSRSVLVIDDDPYLVRALGRRLQAEGMDVRTAGDAWEGITESRQRRPDLMLLDLRLPDRSGFELVEELLCDKDCPPVILVTGDPDERIEQRALELGVLRVFRKSTPQRTIVDTVCDYMDYLDGHSDQPS